MSFITGLKELGKLVEESEETTGNKVNWLKMAPGQTATIRFVNELDEDSPNFDAERGLALVAYEHTNPEDFRRKAVCTMESEGRCFGCEMNERGKKGWYKKPRFYINLLFDDGVEPPKVVVWSMGVRRSQTFAMIREYAIETGSISNLKWRIKRSGSGTDTTWTLIPGGPDATPFDWSDVEVPNLESALRQVPYSEQEQFFLAVKSNEVKDEVDNSSIPW